MSDLYDGLTIDVLGTKYTVEYHDCDEDERLGENFDGYCDPSVKKIVVGRSKPQTDDWEDMAVHERRIIRHELIHAFLYESGLNAECEWALYEEMVDWWALQLPKVVWALKAAGFKYEEILME